jgi:hypothetical protein
MSNLTPEQSGELHLTRQRRAGSHQPNMPRDPEGQYAPKRVFVFRGERDVQGCASAVRAAIDDEGLQGSFACLIFADGLVFVGTTWKGD